ncbi:MAG: hypothetical protein RLZ12_853 [Bacillota bacterium]|jgi:asparagine synthase (glutamine-hydrolysing)
MCGLVALLNKGHEEVKEEVVAAMADVLGHRGPDSAGTYVDGPLGLGFKRLSIVDLSNGTQPMSTIDKKYWLVFNGEIYNYLELRSWLKGKGHKFETKSDTETILHLYKEVGKDVPKYLRGMFAFILWDKEERLLFGARDHFGIKPLYWTKSARSYAFASEIKAFLENRDIEKRLNRKSFGHYLTFQYVPDPDTMFDNIYKVPAGHSFVVCDDKLTLTNYWEPSFAPDEGLSFSECVAKTREVLSESVKQHTVCDVKWGAFLSSGVDSSSIVGLLSQEERIKTFSVGFAIPGYNELEHARRTASFFGTDHYDYEISAAEYLKELPNLIWHQDEPVADPAAVALYFVARLAREHVKVVLSGEGADEFFAGYNIYREPKALEFYVNNVPDGMRKWLGKMASMLPQGVKGRGYLLRGAEPLVSRFMGNALIFSEELKADLLVSGQQYEHPKSITAELYRKAATLDDVKKMQFIDLKLWLAGNILMKADKMTMANSLELRVPFIDKKVFEWAAKIPTKFEVCNGTTKYVLRQAMQDILPSDVYRRKKLGFPVPIRVWLKNEYYKWAQELINDADISHLVNKKFVLNLLNEHRAGRADCSRQLWVILVFILWQSILLGKESASGMYSVAK